MLKPNSKERKVLDMFFRAAAPHYGLYNKTAKCVPLENESNAVYQKNLEIYRDKLAKKIAPERLIDYCRLCIKEKRSVQWISDVVPSSEYAMEDTDRNLLRADDTCFHHSLIEVQMPIAHLAFGADSEDVDGAPVVTRIESFTLEDLLKYFSDAFEIKITADKRKAYIGAFNYLLASYSVDTILYSIDFAIDSGRSIRMPLDLQNRFIQDAEDYITLRRGRASYICSGV